MQARGLTWAGVIAAVGACGGTAVIDPPDDDGTGGSATGTATGAGTGTATGTSTGTSTLDQPCEQACDQLLSCVTLSENCKKGCNAPAGTCDTTQIAMLGCYEQALQGSCTGPYGECDASLEAFLGCRGASISGITFSSPNPNQCVGAVSHQSGDTYESDCVDDVCDCFANGDYVGSCLQDPEVTSSCGSVESCCAAMVYIAAPP